MDYLAESHLMNDEKYSGDALKLLQQLLFYVKTKGQTSAEQEKAFNAIIAAAKARLEAAPPASDTK
jgi:hypothetical protein